MKKYSACFAALIICLLTVIGAAAADTVVYVNDGGTGDGSSASAPLGDLTAAIDKVVNGGKIVITDTYTVSEEFYEPAHKGDIVITGGTLVIDAETRDRYYLSGPGSTTFENMSLLDAMGQGYVIVAQFNKLVMGEGMTTPADKAYIVGGYNTPFEEENIKLDLDSDVTIKSGTYRVVCGSSRGASSTIFTGTSHVTIEGGNINMLLGGSCNGSAMGAMEMTVNGGMISQLMMAGDATRRINGDATLTVNGGSIGQLRVNNIMGHATVNYNGGTIAQAEKSIEDKITEFVTDGTATLNAASNLNSALLALAFDTVNYVGGGAVATTAPVVTTEATTSAETEQSEAPATSESSDVSAAVTEPDATTEPAVTTEKQEETTKAAEKTEKTDATSATAPAATEPAPASEGGLGVGAIVGIIIAALVVIAIVVVIVVKKKK